MSFLLLAHCIRFKHKSITLAGFLLGLPCFFLSIRKVACLLIKYQSQTADPFRRPFQHKAQPKIAQCSSSSEIAVDGACGVVKRTTLLPSNQHLSAEPMFRGSTSTRHDKICFFICGTVFISSVHVHSSKR